jgi:hypothetical protein
MTAKDKKCNNRNFRYFLALFKGENFSQFPTLHYYFSENDLVLDTNLNDIKQHLHI